MLIVSIMWGIMCCYGNTLFHFHGTLKCLSTSIVIPIFRTRFAYFLWLSTLYMSAMHALSISLMHSFSVDGRRISYVILTSSSCICYRAWFSWPFQSLLSSTNSSFSWHFMSSPSATEVTNLAFRPLPPINSTRTRQKKETPKVPSSTGGI